jgi:Ca2+-binding EF-hand superfamily protein
MDRYNDSRARKQARALTSTPGRALTSPSPNNSMQPRNGYTSSRDLPSDLSADQVREIENAFVTFDVDGDKSLGLHELKVAMRALGFEIRLPDAVALMKQHGLDGLMPQESFRKLMENKMRTRDPLEV